MIRKTLCICFTFAAMLAVDVGVLLFAVARLLGHSGYWKGR